MLAALFGNSTAEQVLLYLAINGTAYAQELVGALGLHLSVIQKQLLRLEAGGVLVSFPVGRTRVFEFDPRFAFAGDVRALLRRAFDYLPPRERARYLARRRPRSAAKR